jgi:Glycosyl hydrolases family 39
VIPHKTLNWLRLASILTAIVPGGVVARPQIYAGPDGPITAQYFGMHIHHTAAGTPWPALQFASWRLWDSGVAWPQLEPQPGKWDFALLDRYVQIAADHDVEILLTLGLTPSWASARPQEVSAYGPGNAAAPRRLADWEDYVRVVATRYKGVIHSYEIWNEPNVKGSFSGSPEEMLRLSRAAYEVIKAVDAGITVVSPSPTTGAGVSWLNEFLAKGGCKYSDVIGYHFYVTPDPPEAMIPLIQKVKGVLHSRACDNKPLWNTESGWAMPKHFSSDAEAAGYLMRTYVVNWLMGVERCYWYSWDNHNWSTLELTTRDGNQMTTVGAAYGEIREWMVGAVLRSCSLQTPGVWTCSFDQRPPKSWIVWSESGTAQFGVPKSWGVTQGSNWTGDIQALSSTLVVSSTPRRLTTRAR